MKVKLVAALSMIVLFGCYPQTEWTDLRGGSTDCILVVFAENAASSEVQATLNSLTMIPHENRGERLRPGIHAVVNRDVRGRRGYEICFSASAQVQEKQNLIAAFRNETVVAEVIDDEQQIRESEHESSADGGSS